MGQEPSARLFFALWPDAAVRERLSDILAALPGAGGRKVRQENLHITLLFLGATPRERMPRLQEEARKLGEDAESFDLSIERSGWWRKSGILWLAPAESPPPLEALVRGLAGLAARLELPVHAGDYRPHISLMRKVKSPPSPPAFAPLAWPAREFVLAESITHPEGPEYKLIGRWPLKGEGPQGVRRE